MSRNGQPYRSKRRLSQHEADSTDLPDLAPRRRERTIRWPWATPNRARSFTHAVAKCLTSRAAAASPRSTSTPVTGMARRWDADTLLSCRRRKPPTRRRSGGIMASLISSTSFGGGMAGGRCAARFAVAGRQPSSTSSGPAASTYVTAALRRPAKRSQLRRRVREWCAYGRRPLRSGVAALRIALRSRSE